MYASRPTFLHPHDLYLFGEGTHASLYTLLGAHPWVQDGLTGYRFAVWAPNARAVSLMSEANGWNERSHLLFPVGSSGIWAAFVPAIAEGILYKYAVLGADNVMRHKGDPFSFRVEMRPSVASITWDNDSYIWNDYEWIAQRSQKGLPLHEPMSIYEVHLGSWQRYCGEGHPFLSYDALAEGLLAHVTRLGFTHIELLPIAEHPLDQSWGYQTGYYYAPTSRFGYPVDFKRFIDRFHQAGIGVIMDWVPAHFPKDDWGLEHFDGTALYEHADPRLGEHPDWHTYIFNYGRNEVRNFLYANALYWLREYHIDGLRIDAVASMLYLDYSRDEGEWIPNCYGGHENLEAVSFLQKLNETVHTEFPGAVTIAEESTSWKGVSRPVYTGGLGFSFKWNMGWMHDVLRYFQLDSVYRSYNHNALTFSLLYAFSENFVLPLSHDEVVHGKGSLLCKMAGTREQQFAHLRLLFAYMWGHPGKKLLFMGAEFGQECEWNDNAPLCWELYHQQAHAGLHSLLCDLNAILKAEPAMHRYDHESIGFRWMDCSDYQQSVVSFVRIAPHARPVLWIYNFTPVVRQNYRVPCPLGGVWRELCNTDSSYYGGSNIGNNGLSHASYDAHTGGSVLEITLPPLAALCLVPKD